MRRHRRRGAVKHCRTASRPYREPGLK
jgi:hypothetical protein